MPSSSQSFEHVQSRSLLWLEGLLLPATAELFLQNKETFILTAIA